MNHRSGDLDDSPFTLWHIDRGAGPPLLLVHGFPLDHSMWAEQIDALAGLEHSLVGQTFLSAGQTRMSAPPGSVRIIAPDLRGFGRSPPRGDKVTMDQFADDLAALLDSLDIHEPVVLCGLSMGGYIAFQFCRKYAARLRGLILCDTRAVADTPEAAAGRNSMAQRVLDEGPTPLVESMLPRLLAETTQLKQPEIVERVRAMMMANNPRGIAAAARGMAERPDMTDALAEIRCPTLVVVGEHDAISTPSEMRGIADAIPGAKFVEIPLAGHLSPLENPPAFNAAVADFVRAIL